MAETEFSTAPPLSKGDNAPLFIKTPPLSQEIRDSEAALQSQGMRNETELLTHNQRTINMLWEITQSIIAISVVFANIAGMFIQVTSSDIMANAFFLVAGFYFSRTNHSRVGGITQEYKAR